MEIKKTYDETLFYFSIFGIIGLSIIIYMTSNNYDLNSSVGWSFLSILIMFNYIFRILNNFGKRKIKYISSLDFMVFVLFLVLIVHTFFNNEIIKGNNLMYLIEFIIFIYYYLYLTEYRKLEKSND